MHKTLLLLIGVASFTAPCLRAQEINLFNGRDLAGWDGLKEFWSVKDGAITGRTTKAKSVESNTVLVWTGGEVSDFEFNCKFRITEGNSGIHFRSRLIDRQKFVASGYQADFEAGSKYNGILYEERGRAILASQGQKVVLRPGGSETKLGEVQVTGSLPRCDSINSPIQSGAWNDYKIIAVGNHIQHFINGLQTVDVTDDSGIGARAGILGFQIHKGPAVMVQFKDLRLKRLQSSQPVLANTAPAPSPAATVAAPTAIQTDANQPRIEVLKDQGPNAIEWALAPLEQAVPGDIRQNLTFLREDLLTETQDKPKLSATREAGARLCDAIIGVLDERKLTLAKAGFRAVEASARTGVTSQALEARRNYQMSWPQFAREESQRAELKSQALGNAQVIAERPKLDWAQRTATLQKPLDDLYRQYCEALRQSAK